MKDSNVTTLALAFFFFFLNTLTVCQDDKPVRLFTLKSEVFEDAELVCLQKARHMGTRD